MLTKCFSFSSKANKTRGFFVFFFFPESHIYLV